MIYTHARHAGVPSSGCEEDRLAHVAEIGPEAPDSTCTTRCGRDTTIKDPLRREGSVEGEALQPKHSLCCRLLFGW